jgi:predicted flap endonuclease-1-like 5' DNA nuclease
MFNNDVTQTYNHQDATLEILVMMAGAFLLGCLLCWLIRKLLGMDNNTNQRLTTASNIVSSHDINKAQHNSTTATLKPQALTGSNQSQVKTVTKNVAPTHYSKPKIDDLTKISGINMDVETELRSRDIKSYTDLRDSSKQSILDTLDTASGKSVSSKEAQTWPHQASLAAKGEWEKLVEYQEFMARTKKAADKIRQEALEEKSSVSTTNKAEDLKMVEGIGPKIEEILNLNGVNTFKDLRTTDRDTLKSYLDDAGSRFKMHEPQSWPHQAGMAEREEWESLKIYQEFMDGGREIPSVSASAKIDLEDQTAIDDVEADFKQEILPDDLKKIEGIGPKIEEILKSHGITTYLKLHETDRDTIKGYLDKAGPQFKMHEPESWPHQAGMASTGQWEELRIYQEFMDGGREVPSASASSSLSAPKSSAKATSLHVKEVPKNEFDDFKIIEGIGPKIQELLNTAGIRTYKDLKNSDRDTMKKLLDDGGPQYRMHEPETWPAQAKLAFENEWDKLEDFKEEIINGRIKDN